MLHEALLESQKHIDKEIEVLKSQIRALYTSRNAFALVNQLPIETLTEIFLWLQISILASSKSYQRNSFLAWMRVTHVSKYWRTVAFNSKALWTDIPINHLAYAELASQLSHPLPISLTNNHNIGWETFTSNDTLGTLLPLLPRVRKVEYDANRIDGEIFAKALQNAPPKSPWFHEMILGYFTFESEASPFPDSLKVLELRHCEAPFIWSWCWLKFDHLTDLCLQTVDPRITVDSFLDCVAQIPKLSCLDVAWIFKDLPPTTTVPRPTARDLPTLQRVVVEEYIVSMTTLLRNVKFGELFTLKIGICTTWEDPNHAEIVDFFEQVDQLVKRQPIRTGTFMVDGAQNHTFVGFGQGGSTPIFEVEVNSDQMTDQMMRLFTLFIQALSFDRLEKLSTNIARDVYAWPQCRFKDLKNLRELDLQGHDTAWGLLSFLEIEARQAEQDDDWNLLSFPAVTSITLRDFLMQYTIGKSTVTMFANRAKHGCPTKELTFVGGTLTDKGLELLREAIDKVTVIVDDSCSGRIAYCM